MDLGSLRPRGRDESIDIACGWTLLGVVWRAFREGVSAVAFGVEDPFSKKAPSRPNPRKGAELSKP